MEQNLERKTTPSHKKNPKLWVIASGKGGVGKSFITTSLGLTLTKLGHSVTVVDLDLTGANVHTCLGLDPNPTSLRDWLEGRRPFHEIVFPSPFPRLSLVQGLWDSWAPVDFPIEKIKKLMGELRELKSEFVLIDLGAGATEAHLEVFRSADEKILVSSPEPTSIEKTYRFFESHICASLQENALPEAYSKLLETLREYRQRLLKKPFSFRAYLKENPGFVVDHFEDLSRRPIRLLINSARSESNTHLGHSMKSVCSKYYDLGIDYVGSIDYDNAVWQSARSREPALVAQPFTPLAGQFLALCKHLIAHEEIRAVG